MCREKRKLEPDVNPELKKKRLNVGDDNSEKTKEQLSLIERIERPKEENMTRALVLLFLKKNSDYGDSAWITLEKYGIKAYKTRAYDKLLRIQTLLNREDDPEVEESIRDTVLDIFVYSCITECWFSGENSIVELVKIVENGIKNQEVWLNLLARKIDFDKIVSKAVLYEIDDIFEEIKNDYKQDIGHDKEEEYDDITL
jgi:hypothetical protein